MRAYTTTLQSPGSVPGDLMPPGGRGWELFSFMSRPDGFLIVAWSRDEVPCPDCFPGSCRWPDCPAHHPHPNCPYCRGTGMVPGA